LLLRIGLDSLFLSVSLSASDIIMEEESKKIVNKQFSVSLKDCLGADLSSVAMLLNNQQAL